MGDHRSHPRWNRRLAVYSYLRPIVTGRRVLELGCGTGEGAAHLAALGARAVVATDDDALALREARERLKGRPVSFAATLAEAGGGFDVVVVPDAERMVREEGGRTLATVRKLLAPRGRLISVVANGDVGQGVAFYDLHDALAPHFPRVRMLGQTPFVAFGVAEFDEAAGGLRVDSSLIEGASEEPSHYIAVAGPDEALALGYALVQVPADAPVAAAAPAALAAAGDTAELRRRLAEAEGQAEGALRVSRAQTEEIEELRARLRRAAEARAELDEEAMRLRSALGRTTEEMTSLAQRVTAGLRGGGGVDHAAPSELRRELAARESALSDRDERIAALEGERQDLLWRLDSAEDALAQARRSRGATAPVAAPSRDGDELLAALDAREQALDEYRRAAAVHVDEVTRLRDALTEQATLVAELEEALALAEARAAAAEQEVGGLRKLAAEIEEADRVRRSRLAELEGTLLRLQRQAATAAERPGNGAAATEAQKLAAARAERAQLEETSRAERAQLEQTLRGQISALERQLAEAGQGEDGAHLEGAVAEVARLRAALERSEEQLWEARTRTQQDRERIAALVAAASSSERAGAEGTEIGDPLARVLEELAAIEAGLRAEAQELSAVERSLNEWRTAVGEETTADSPGA